MPHPRLLPFWDKETLEKAAAEASSIAELLRNLGIRERGSAYVNIRRAAAEFGVALPDTPQPGAKHHRSLSEVLVENSTYNDNRQLKKRLVAEGLLENECAECHIPPERNGRPLVLTLDHINGTTTDNRLENLRLLCPNCHSQTNTFGGKNKRVGRRRPRCARVSKFTRAELDELSEFFSGVAVVRGDWPRIADRLGVTVKAARHRYQLVGRYHNGDICPADCMGACQSAAPAV